MYGRLKIHIRVDSKRPNKERERKQELSLIWDRAKASFFAIEKNCLCQSNEIMYLKQRCEFLWISPRPACYEQCIVSSVSVVGAGNLQRLQVRGQACHFKLTKHLLSLAYSPSQTLPYIHFEATINWTLRIRFSLRFKGWIIGTPWGNRLLNFCIRVIWSVLHAVFRSASLSNEWDVKWVPRAQEKAEWEFLSLSETHGINPAYTIVCQSVTNT